MNLTIKRHGRYGTVEDGGFNAGRSHIAFAGTVAENSAAIAQRHHI